MCGDYLYVTRNTGPQTLISRLFTLAHFQLRYRLDLLIHRYCEFSISAILVSQPLGQLLVLKEVVCTEVFPEAEQLGLSHAGAARRISRVVGV